MVFNWFKRQVDKKEKNAATQQQEQESQAAAQPETVAQSSDATDAATAADTAPSNADDYLQWAKAAYQAIQKQSVSEDAPAAQTDEIADPPESAKAEESVMPEESTAIEEDTAERDTAERDTAERDTAEGDTADATDATTETIAPPDPSELVDVAPNTAPETLADSEVDTSKAATDAATDATTDVTADAIASETITDTTADTTAETTEEPRAGAIAETADVTSRDTADSLPFWAKADAERQERLERIKETAIEEEVEPESTADIDLDEDFVWSAGVLASQGRRPDEVSAEEITWLTKLRQGLGKTRRGLINQLRSIVGQGPLNEAAVMEIEDLLLQADVGIDATDYVIEALQNRMREGALPSDEAIAYLKEILRGILDQPFASGKYPEEFVPDNDCLNIWMLAGVNGAGKTTTIGKLAHMTRSSDYHCLIAAADTFRAAAVEQVKAWGDRSGVEVIANPGKNTDPAAVVFDAISAAQSRNIDVLLVDTAGRLQNKKNLMDELGKIRRIVDKKAANAKVESLLVLDATLGQNGLRQAQVFSEAAGLSGVVLTKLDGSARGGVALAVVQQLGLPIRFIGAGEGIEDLRPFSSYEFVEALLSD